VAQAVDNRLWGCCNRARWYLKVVTTRSIAGIFSKGIALEASSACRVREGCPHTLAGPRCQISSMIKLLGMKVLQLGKFCSPRVGGMESHLEELAAGLQAYLDVEVLAANEALRKEKSWVNGVQVTRVASLGEFVSTPLTWGLSREIAKSDADIIHLHAPNPMGMNAFLRSGYSGKLVIVHHADIIGRKSLKKLIWPVWKRCMDRASAIIVSSKTLAETSEELAPYRDKWRIIPLGMDFGFLDNVSTQDVENVRARFPGSIVLYVGRLVPYKGLQFLIAAMRDIDATLLIIGKGIERGREETRLRLMAKTLGDKVRFLGRVPSLGAYYRAADLFVLPSCGRNEAFGLVQLEAMYCGLPVINTSLPTGVPEVSIHGLTGLTVPPGNSRCLSEAISTLLADPALRARFSVNARERAKIFTIESMVARTLAVYEDVLSVKSAQSLTVAKMAKV
jgi:glycosyltransferase involved in cell wall biosynthesis